MSYKLICTDMDGTLLNDNKEISLENRIAIKNAIDNGVVIVFCTGRLFTFAKYYAQGLGVNTPIIASNGAYIREQQSNNILYKCPLGVENSFKVVEILKKYNINPHFNSSDTVFTGKISFSSESYLKLNQSLSKEEQFKVEVVKDLEKMIFEYKEEILKCIAIDMNLDNIKIAKEEIFNLGGLVVESSFYNNFEVMNKEVSKGKAVKLLGDYYGIKKEEIICIGDNENDLSMINYAGLGVAMGNSIDSVKAQSDFISSTNNEDGVAQVIRKFVL